MRSLCTFQSVWICRMAALSFIIFVIDGLFSTGAVMALIFYRGYEAVGISVCLLILMPFFCALWLLFGSQFRCPTCLETPLYLKRQDSSDRSGCLRAPDRMRVAVSIISSSSFRCSCCGETAVVRTLRR